MAIGLSGILRRETLKDKIFALLTSWIVLISGLYVEIVVFFFFFFLQHTFISFPLVWFGLVLIL